MCAKGIKINAYNKTQELGKIIGFDETVTILNLIEERPRQYKEFEELKILPKTTLVRRLTTLQNLGVIQKQSIFSNRRETHVYNLTKQGIEFMKFHKFYEKEMKIPDAVRIEEKNKK
jgi:DNA-binding HxlR family transcriptional regulator